VSLAADLEQLAPSLAPPGSEGASPCGRGPRLCPRLITTYSPRVDWPRPDVARHGDWQAHDRWRRLAWVPEAPGSPGLVSPAKSVHRGPYGASGLTSNGRREIWRSLKLLEDQKTECFFWTITLPTEALAGIAAGRGWAAFQDRVRHELVRLLTDRLGVALVIGVAEVQPKRLRTAGVYAPHLHVAFVGRRKGWVRWAFNHADLDGIIERAAEAAGAPAFTATSAGNVEPIRASVAAYMAKYMTKGAQGQKGSPNGLGLLAAVGEAVERLRPRQWWFRSSPLLAWVREHVFPLHLPFVVWVHENRRRLEQLELIRHQQVQGLPESAPLCWRVDWRGPPQLAQVVALWQEWVEDAEWRQVHHLLHDRTGSLHHPQHHQLV
jgi:hypothetical protein